MEQANLTTDYAMMFNAMKSELKQISEQQIEEIHNRFDQLSKRFTRGSRSRSHNRNRSGTKGANYEDYSASEDEERAEKPKRDSSKEVKVATVEFTEYALIWWDQVRTGRRMNGEPQVRSWHELKAMMRKRFVPSYYNRDLYSKLQTLTQGNMSVENYYKEIEMAMMRANIQEDNEATMARFLRGLKPKLQEALELQHYLDIGELLELAIKAERGKKQRSSGREPKEERPLKRDKESITPDERAEVEEVVVEAEKWKDEAVNEKCEVTVESAYEVKVEESELEKEVKESDKMSEASNFDEKCKEPALDSQVESIGGRNIEVSKGVFTFKSCSTPSYRLTNDVPLLLYPISGSKQAETYFIFVDVSTTNELDASLTSAATHLLQDYQDVIPEDIPSGLPPLRGIEHQIDFICGASLPNKAPYRTNPKKTKEQQRQVDELLGKEWICESLSSCAVPVLHVPKKDGGWRMCMDCRAINAITVLVSYELIEDKRSFTALTHRGILVIS
nr:uncharacterized protein LOC113729084 [Coffea arabica]